MMTGLQRAKQFQPYAALKGFETAIIEQSARSNIEPRICLGEDAAEELNAKLVELTPGDGVAVRYYCGSRYMDTAGYITKICPEQKCLLLGETKIRFRDIADIAAF